MKKILITGVGFIGSHVVRLFVKKISAIPNIQLGC
jgi:nucleoside-diphosphate-sugar epimerase